MPIINNPSTGLDGEGGFENSQLQIIVIGNRAKRANGIDNPHTVVRRSCGASGQNRCAKHECAKHEKAAVSIATPTTNKARAPITPPNSLFLVPAHRRSSPSKQSRSFHKRRVNQRAIRLYSRGMHRHHEALAGFAVWARGPLDLDYIARAEILDRNNIA